MAVEAVASVVIQKLAEMLAQEPLIHNHKRGLATELQLIKNSIKNMRAFLLDDSKTSDSQLKAYLLHLYHIEDAIETLALRFPCDSDSDSDPFPFLGCCTYTNLKLPFGLASLTNYHLSRKIKKLRYRIDKLLPTTTPPVPPLQKLTSLKLLKSTSSHHTADFDTTSDEVKSTAAAHPPIPEEEETSRLLYEHTVSISRENLPVKTMKKLMSNASVLADRFYQSRLVNYSFDEEKLDIGGLRRNAASLVDELVPTSTNTNTYTHHRQVVSIIGERGSGKTTLARAVYGSKKVKQHFKSCSAWVTASKGSSSTATPDLFFNLLTQITSSIISSHTHTDDLKAKILELLKDKRYLIVLEDVESSETWDHLQSAFPDEHQQNGSRILLITCNRAVAARANSRVLQLEKLDIVDSWNLFLRKACLEKGHEDLKPRILQVCNGLHLNIVLLGSLLSTKEDEEWPVVLNSRPNWGTLELISLSYDDLPVHLKLCLIYMVLFPKEFDIPVRRLQRLWLAEGFVARSEESSAIFPEDVVRGYFDHLVKRSLIQVSKLTSDGSPKRCRLLGVLHDHLIPKAEAVSLFHVHNRYSGSSCEVAGPVFARRLVEYTDIKNCSLNPSRLRRLRSYLSLNLQKKDTPATEVGKLLSSVLNNGLRLLRVLDLEGVYKPSLPDNLGDFFQLRYLGLRWTFLDTLPESVGRLHYLETLDIKHTYIATLPPFIWKMKHLKHLNANGAQLDLPSGFSLPKLVTLSGFSVDDKSLKKDGGLKHMVHVRELEITFQLSKPEEIMDWIVKLTAIQALRLRSKDDTSRPSKLILKPLSGLKQLTHLNLLGNLPSLPGDGDFPPELKVLTLSVSQLSENPMPVLGKLPKLTVLRLLANSFLGNTMTCPAGGFKELRVLKLWMLKNLEHWDVEDGAMEKLKELNIRCCNKLKMIPPQLLAQMNELTLTNMSPEFRSEVVRIIPHESVTSNHYDFSPLPWEEADGDGSM